MTTARPRTQDGRPTSLCKHPDTMRHIETEIVAETEREDELRGREPEESVRYDKRGDSAVQTVLQ